MKTAHSAWEGNCQWIVHGCRSASMLENRAAESQTALTHQQEEETASLWPRSLKCTSSAKSCSGFMSPVVTDDTTTEQQDLWLSRTSTTASFELLLHWKPLKASVTHAQEQSDLEMLRCFFLFYCLQCLYLPEAFSRATPDPDQYSRLSPLSSNRLCIR